MLKKKVDSIVPGSITVYYMMVRLYRDKWVNAQYVCQTYGFQIGCEDRMIGKWTMLNCCLAKASFSTSDIGCHVAVSAGLTVGRGGLSCYNVGKVLSPSARFDILHS
jgi:hypothetical protein